GHRTAGHRAHRRGARRDREGGPDRCGLALPDLGPPPLTPLTPLSPLTRRSSHDLSVPARARPPGTDRPAPPPAHEQRDALPGARALPAARRSGAADVRARGRP